MEKSLRYLLPKYAQWSSVSYSRASCVLPLHYAINQNLLLHHDKRPLTEFQGKMMSSSATVDAEKDGLLRRLVAKFRNAIPDKTKIDLASHKIYESIADTIDIREFMKYFELPDTFQSWFLVIELHIWMAMVRTVGGRNGRFMRNKLVDVMWEDVEVRLGRLIEIRPSMRKQGLRTMNEQFQAAIISYDEGFFSEDIVLAGAIWRIFFDMEYRDPRLLEMMVFYIRKQIAHLDSLDSEKMMERGVISWIPLKEVISDLDEQR